jgi:predicted transcriptional regulator
LSESLDEKIFSILQNSDGRSISQSDLGKALKMNSREISRTVSKLEKRGLIKRVQIKEKGRNAYRITMLKQHQKIDLNDVVWCACLTCPDLERCGKGQPVSPESCTKLTASIKAEQSKLSVLGEGKHAQ